MRRSHSQNCTDAGGLNQRLRYNKNEPEHLYQRLVQTARAANPSITAIATSVDKAADIKRESLRLELEAIQSRYEDGSLPRASYKRLRENVALMQMDLEDNL